MLSVSHSTRLLTARCPRQPLPEEAAAHAGRAGLHRCPAREVWRLFHSASSAEWCLAVQVTVTRRPDPPHRTQTPT